jgi:hypothetical protein
MSYIKDSGLLGPCLEETLKKLFLFAIFTLSSVCAFAQPANYTDLGVIGDTTANYNTPDFTTNSTVGTNVINWYRFQILGATGATGSFFDIDLFATGATLQLDSEIGIYDSVGNMIANDDDDGHSLRSALTFGNTTPRAMPPDPFGFTNGLAANGRDGNLTAGVYWLAIGQFDTVFNATNWDVTSTAGGAGNTVAVNFRTDVVPEPASLAALGLGALALIRRKRSKK